MRKVTEKNGWVLTFNVIALILTKIRNLDNCSHANKAFIQVGWVILTQQMLLEFGDYKVLGQ
ncbi:MAG: hypothetical protein Q8M40_12785 [Legionella sp.]|nr:hypothetical protein [Legionella sp.]